VSPAEVKDLQTRYVYVLQTVNKISKELAEYHAHRSSEQEMLVHVQWYERQKADLK
jgi:hypothetical protein